MYSLDVYGHTVIDTLVTVQLGDVVIASAASVNVTAQAGLSASEHRSGLADSSWYTSASAYNSSACVHACGDVHVSKDKHRRQCHM